MLTEFTKMTFEFERKLISLKSTKSRNMHNNFDTLIIHKQFAKFNCVLAKLPESIFLDDFIQ